MVVGDRWFFITDSGYLMGPYTTYDQARLLSDQATGSEPFSMDPRFMMGLMNEDAKKALLDMLGERDG